LIASHVDMRGSKRALNTWESGLRRRGSCSGEEMIGGRRGEQVKEWKSEGGKRTVASVSQRTTPGNSLLVWKAAAASGVP
jgi:hypothetical protein